MNSLGVLKSVILYINGVMERYYIKKKKTVLCLLTGVGITAIRKLCRPNCYCVSTRVDLPHLLFITLRYDSTGSRLVHASIDTAI